DFSALIKALRQDDLVKLLAEPTVVATHGRPARFIVGGKVPYIVPSGNGAVSVRYEEYGTSVDFLPFVVGPGRIRLEVRPEVSEVDSSRSIINESTQVFAFTHRYVETAVELQAGQTFALAGLLQTRTEATRRSTPFFGELPYIGTFFRRINERRNDIELLVTVTPEVVAAMDPCETPISGPGLNSDSPNDKEFYLRGFLEV
ncbi:bacterial type II/III secretion system protein, partial [Rhodopirellula maiorica SM1]